MAALQTGRHDAGTSQRSSAPGRRRMAQANINPVTGLSTDYLNHFNEAVLLLEMIRTMTDCGADLSAWRPRSYRDHFLASPLRQSGLALTAYDNADPALRRRFDALCATMNDGVQTIRRRLERAQGPEASAKIAAGATTWLKLRMARAAAMIHGADPDRAMRTRGARARRGASAAGSPTRAA